MPALSAEQRMAFLGGIPLFSGLGIAELVNVAELFRETRVRKGETVAQEGEAGDELFLIVGGELEVWGGEPRRAVGRLGPGEFFGEMSLLTDEPRSATVTVARPAHLLVLAREDFRRVVDANPRLLESVSRVLGHRLASRMRDESSRRNTLAIAVIGPADLKGKTLVASALAGMLGELTGRDALLVTTASEPSRAAPSLATVAGESPDRIRARVEREGHGPGVLAVDRGAGTSGDGFVQHICTLVERLAPAFPILVFDVFSRREVAADAAAEACDVVVRLTRRAGPAQAPEAHTRVYDVLNLHDPATEPIPVNRCEPFVLPSDPALIGLVPRAQARHVRENRWSPGSPPLRRLARKILGATVGVALGGGAAFGIAHVGVLKVLEENDIPVDVVVGTSFGSIVALGYAAGIRPAEMVEIARRIGNKRTTISALDFTVSKPGLLAGKRLVSIFSPFTGPIQRFEQLTVPCQTVATDIETGERVCLGEGRLDEAFRASCAVPMLWAPVRREGRTLVDGGIADPVPADVVRTAGADVCVAVNVVPRLQRGVETVLTRLNKRAKALNPLTFLTGTRDMPNRFDIVMNAIQILQHELGAFSAVSADVLIDVDLSGFTWVEFYRALELIERGAGAAERALPDVKRVLDERIAAGLRA